MTLTIGLSTKLIPDAEYSTAGWMVTEDVTEWMKTHSKEGTDFETIQENLVETIIREATMKAMKKVKSRKQGPHVIWGKKSRQSAFVVKGPN
jgi:hypothetical protein